MYQSLFENIQGIQKHLTLMKSAKYIMAINWLYSKKINDKQRININFICTHNSRRSHLSQIWAQAAASYFNIPGVHCYSGGTEETALFPKIIETLKIQGFNILKYPMATILFMR